MNKTAKKETLNKNDLINFVASDTGLSKADSSRAIDSIIHSIQNGLKVDKEIRFVGFGTFEVRERKETKGRNPRTGEDMKIPARKVVKFKPGKGLREAVEK